MPTLLEYKFPFVTLNGFLYRVFSDAMIVHTRANQLLPKLLMEQFVILPSKCRHIEHMPEGVWFQKKMFLT